MKKISIRICAMILIVFLLATLCLTGCVGTQSQDVTDNYVLRHAARCVGQVSIWTDPETGVQYILYYNGTTGGAGITVRLNPDGTPVVSEENAK